MPSTSARTLKGPRRLSRRHDRRAPSPRWQFLRGFFKHPKMVGSIIPSSRILIERMLGPVDWENTRLFVEYGPGVGTFTRPILDLLGPDAKLLVCSDGVQSLTLPQILAQAALPAGRIIAGVLAAAKEHQDNITVVKLERAR